MKGRTKREPSLPSEMKYRPDTVKPGDTLILYGKERDEEKSANAVKIVKRELRVIKPHPNYILCVSPKGIRECLMYHDLEQYTKPEGVYSEYYLEKKLRKTALQAGRAE